MRRLTPAAAVVIALLLFSAGASGRMLVASGQQTFSPALAVSNGGNMLAAWFQGPGPCVSSYACDTNWTGSEVMLAAGTTRGGFSRPTLVSHDGDDEDGAVQAAESGAGVGYVAWEALQQNRAEIVTVRRGVVSPARVFLPKDVNQVQLLTSPSGQVASVWSQYGHGDPVIRYALLARTGRIERVVTVLHTNPSIGEDVAYSLGARGRLAVGWTAGATAKMTTCDPANGCAVPQSVVSVGMYGSVAVALSDGGTVTVATGGGAGVSAATEQFGGRLSKAAMLDAGGELPTATAIGHNGGLVMFDPGPVPYTTLAWSQLGPSGFSSPVTLRDPDTLDTAALAGNLRGQFAAAWIDSVRPSGPDSLRLALGEGSAFGSPLTIVPGSGGVNGLPPPIGIDGAGNAVVLWNRWCASGASYGPCGMFADVVRR